MICPSGSIIVQLFFMAMPEGDIRKRQVDDDLYFIWYNVTAEM